MSKKRKPSYEEENRENSKTTDKQTSREKQRSLSRKKTKRTLSYLPLLLGIIIFSYPFVSNSYYKMKQKQANDIYFQETGKEELAYQNKIKAEYEQYNKNLAEQNYQDLSMPFDKAQRDNTVSGKSKELGKVLAVVEVPKIRVKLPVYNGTSETQLQQGLGLLTNTSLPIGGTGTHSVITGHRGLPSAKLFTDLPKLALKDQFYVHIQNETHAYEIDQIKVVEPTEMDDLQIVNDQDYVTLLTCTPYMVNTHRLLVRGHRVPYNEERRVSDLKAANNHYWLEISLFIVGAGATVLFITWRIKKKRLKP